MNDQKIKDGDIIYIVDNEEGFEVVDFAWKCDDNGCYSSSLGVYFTYDKVKLLMTQKEFENKIK